MLTTTEELRREACLPQPATVAISRGLGGGTTFRPEKNGTRFRENTLSLHPTPYALRLTLNQSDKSVRDTERQLEPIEVVQIDIAVAVEILNVARPGQSSCWSTKTLKER